MSEAHAGSPVTRLAASDHLSLVATAGGGDGAAAGVRVWDLAGLVLEDALPHHHEVTWQHRRVSRARVGAGGGLGLAL